MTDDRETKVAQEPGHIQFISPINDDWYEDIISFDNTNNRTVHQQYKYIWRKTKQIIAHEEPLIVSLPNNKGSWYNAMVEWDIGETNTEPIYTIVVDASFKCDQYKNEKFIFDSDIQPHAKIYKCYTELIFNEK